MSKAVSQSYAASLFAIVRKEDSGTGRHIAKVVRIPDNHGYPYQAQCACGWFSLGYVREHAAQQMLELHKENA